MRLTGGYSWLVAGLLAAAAGPALGSAIEIPAAGGADAARRATPAKTVRSISGNRNGMSYTATSRIIGQTPTSGIPVPPALGTGGGNPLYYPSSNKSGVVALIMEYEDGSAFICSGSLLSDRRSIATAGHCVSDGAGTANPFRTTAYFYEGNPDERTPFQLAGTAIEISDYFVNPDYTGEVIDQNDIAVLRLKTAAPLSALSYRLDNSNTLTGTGFNVAGYGGRSTVGGAIGSDARTGYLREGDNVYDYAWGDAAFNGFFTDVVDGENFFGTADIEYSFVSDFDNGFAANDTAGRIAAAVGAGGLFNDTGLGAREANIAGGDSGGPGFVNGRLASINSYGLSFGPGFGDFRAGLNSSWGEFSGYVPIYIHRDFIISSFVPEPGAWAMLIAGFGLTGGMMRRRRDVVAMA